MVLTNLKETSSLPQTEEWLIGYSLSLPSQLHLRLMLYYSYVIHHRPCSRSRSWVFHKTHSEAVCHDPHKSLGISSMACFPHLYSWCRQDKRHFQPRSKSSQYKTYINLFQDVKKKITIPIVSEKGILRQKELKRNTFKLLPGVIIISKIHLFNNIFCIH